MNSQLFFLLNVVIGIAFVIWFFGGSRDNSRTSLKLKSDKPADVPRFRDSPSVGPLPETPSAVASPPRPSEAPSPRPSEAAPRVTQSELQQAAAKEERARRVKDAKPLNILFLYNGHDWDAYEVLGLPAGAGLTLVTQRYQELVKTGDAGQLEFFGAAYQSILKKL